MALAVAGLYQGGGRHVQTNSFLEAMQASTFSNRRNTRPQGIKGWWRSNERQD